MRIRTANKRRLRRDRRDAEIVERIFREAAFNALECVVGRAINKFYDRVLPDMLAYRELSRMRFNADPNA